MSLVIGYRDYADGTVWMASDGQSTFGCAQVEVVKLRRYAALLVGTTGLHRVNNLILDVHAPLLKPEPDEEPYHFGIRFAQGLRVLCKENGVLTANKEGQEDMATRILLGYAGHIIGVSSDFAVSDHAPWWAIGCGCEWAEGALAALDRLDGPRLNPSERLRFVLEVVASLDIHVAPPYTILCAPGPDEE